MEKDFVKSLAILIVAGLFMYVIPKFTYTQVILEQASNATSTTQTSNVTSTSTLNLFYYTEDISDTDKTVFTFFRSSTEIGSADIQTHTFTLPSNYISVFVDSGLPQQILLVDNQDTEAKIYTLDVSVFNSQPVLVYEIPLNYDFKELVDDARYIDNNRLAIVTSRGYDGAFYTNITMHIISLQNSNQNYSYKIVDRGEMYAGFSIIAVNSLSQDIYIEETGGDAGAIWSQWYVTNINKRTVRQLDGLPPHPKYNAQDDGYGFNPVFPKFNTSASKIVFNDFSVAINPEHIDYDSFDYEHETGPCLKTSHDLLENVYAHEGGVIMLRDMKTGITKEIYRNLNFENNFCQNIGRSIISVAWMDDDTIIFNTVEGIYSLNITNNEMKLLYTYYDDKRALNAQTRLPIAYVQLPWIVLSQGYYQNPSILNIESGKKIDLFFNKENYEGFFVK